MKEIVQTGAPVLRETAADVPINEIVEPHIQTLLSDMRETLEKQKDGAALAAPQVGEPLRIFLLSERVFGGDAETEYASKDPHLTFINPRLTKTSKRKVRVDEGCLSVRGTFGHVDRYERATVEAYDEHGQLFTRGASGLMAQAFQHEIDHLDGTLFIDKAYDMYEVDLSKENDE